MRLSRDEWKHIIRLFQMEQNSTSIIEQTQFERRRVFRATTKIRIVLAQEVPEVFSGTVEVDETYVGSQWKKTNVNLFVITVRNGGEGPRNNRYWDPLPEWSGLGQGF